VGSYGFGTGVYSFESYRYHKFEFSDKSSLQVTCLLVPGMEKNIQKILSIEAELNLKVLATI